MCDTVTIIATGCDMLDSDRLLRLFAYMDAHFAYSDSASIEQDLTKHATRAPFAPTPADGAQAWSYKTRNFGDCEDTVSTAYVRKSSACMRWVRISYQQHHTAVLVTRSHRSALLIPGKARGSGRCEVDLCVLSRTLHVCVFCSWLAFS